jgi:hypothetical protein
MMVYIRPTFRFNGNAAGSPARAESYAHTARVASLTPRMPPPTPPLNPTDAPPPARPDRTPGAGPVPASPAGASDWPATLALHTGALGDVLLFGRLCQALPAPVRLLAPAGPGRLLADLGVVASWGNVHDLPLHEAFATGQPDGLARAMGRATRLVSCFATGRAGAERQLLAATGAERADFLPIRPPDRWAGHLVDLWTTMLMLPPLTRRTAWPVPAGLRRAGVVRLAALGITRPGDAVLIHPGSGGSAKCWPAERYVALARRLVEAGHPVVWLVGPVERERWGDRPPVGRDAAGAVWLEPDLADLAGALSQSRAYVGNDSGVSHLAGLVGTRTVALFGPTQPAHFSPLGPDVRIVARAALGDIAPDEVLAAMERPAGG